MKKLFLLAASALVTLGAFAQGATEPTWKVVVNTTEPNEVKGEVTYDMVKAGVQKNGSDVYTYTFTLTDAKSYKPAKSFITVSYIAATEGVTAVEAKSTILVQPNEGDLTITVSAYADATNKKIYVNWSNNDAAVCDSKFYELAYFPGTRTGENVSKYFNAPLKSNEFKPAGNIYGGDGDNYLQGKSSNTFAVSRNKIPSGIYKASFDYKTAIVTIADVETIDVAINGFCTFVAPIEVTLPEGVKAYTLAYNPEEPTMLAATKIDEGKIAANIPVVLKADAGTYKLPVTGTPIYDLDNDGKLPTFIRDSKCESNVLVGVHQPHYLPDACYNLDGSNFVQWIKTDNTDTKGNISHVIVHPFSAYVNLPADVARPSTLTVNFPADPSTPTGINGIDSENDEAAQSYNLFGMPVGRDYKGIVIRNGKKYIQK